MGLAISAALVKELRERTALGMMECKKALVEAGGDIALAIENLRKASALKAEKKAGRTAAEGVVAVRIAEGAAVVVEVNSETDFAARDGSFLAFVGAVSDAALAAGNDDLAALMASGLEEERSALVQKIGENISVRRMARMEGGVIGSYVHSNDRIAVLVKLEGGTPEVAKEIAMHVAAVSPKVISPDDMPQDVLDKEREIIKAQPDMAGKPENIVEKMLIGRINKFLKENSLLKQPFVKNPEQTVEELAKEAGATVVEMIRFEVGEGIEKEHTDFAAEVAAQVNAAK